MHKFNLFPFDSRINKSSENSKMAKSTTLALNNEPIQFEWEIFTFLDSWIGKENDWGQTNTHTVDYISP